jgi:release factor glutamine methyltransferase
MISRALAQANVRAALRDANIDTADMDSRLLLEAATGLDRVAIMMAPDALLNADEAAQLRALTERRLLNEPMAYILGKREFRSLEFITPPGVLIPRPDTETLIEAALAAAPNAKRILDMGVGSGCILLSLLHALPDAEGWGVDQSAVALQTTSENARRLGLSQRVHLIASDWGAALDQSFDLVVSNPPYIPAADIETLAPDVKDFEPRAALDGGADGLAAYRIIADQLPRLLAPVGVAALEVGWDQGAAVERLLTLAGLRDVQVRKDLAGRDRVALARRS